MYKAIKDNKIIAISEQKYAEVETEEETKEIPLSPEAHFHCLVFDEVIEDTEHTIEDYIHCDGEFVLTTDEKAIILKNQEKVSEARQYLESTDYVAIKIAEGVATKEDYAEVLAKREEARELIRSLENK